MSLGALWMAALGAAWIVLTLTTPVRRRSLPPAGPRPAEPAPAERLDGPAVPGKGGARRG